jgi:rare lipoprotein A
LLRFGPGGPRDASFFHCLPFRHHTEKQQEKRQDYRMRIVPLWGFLFFTGTSLALAGDPPKQDGLASWYGEEHRGKLMANGRKFDPDKPTAASWFYPLGTKLRVAVKSASGKRRCVEVTVTDRGPAPHLVRGGRIIDLGRAAFKKLAQPDLGLVAVSVQAVE